MNVVQDKIYTYAKVLFLLILVYSSIYIKNVDLIRVKSHSKNTMESQTTEKNAENNSAGKTEDTAEQNPWKELMKKYSVTTTNSVKPIKGAVFGKWTNKKCEPLRSSQVDRALYGLDLCGGKVYNRTWRYYSQSTSCVFSNEKPDCLIYDITSFSFTPLSTSKINDYELPPCNHESQNWIIRANYEDVGNQNYTCNGNNWVGTNGKQISNFKSIDTWNNIKAEAASYDEDEDEEVEEYIQHKQPDENSIVVEPDPKISANTKQTENKTEESAKANTHDKTNPWKQLMKMYDQSNVKPIKGARFGKWKDGKCKPLKNKQANKYLYDLQFCSTPVQKKEWKSYMKNMGCHFFYKRPNCLIYYKTAYSFTPFSTFRIEQYELPPCINLSQGWVIKVSCKNKVKQNYTCTNRQWIGSDDSEISTCEITDTLESILKEEREHDEDNVLYNEDDDQYDEDDDENDEDDDENNDEDHDENNHDEHKSDNNGGDGSSKKNHEKKQGQQPNTHENKINQLDTKETNPVDDRNKTAEIQKLEPSVDDKKNHDTSPNQEKSSIADGESHSGGNTEGEGLLHSEPRKIEKETGKKLTKNKDEENPWKNLMTVYNVSANNSVKPVKGAIFGKWKKNRCERLHNVQLKKLGYGLKLCAYRMNSNFWTSYTKYMGCRFFDEIPDCFIYARKAFSFTSLSISNITNYNLPPCINASENWIIEASCSTSEKQNYTCNGNDWVGKDNITITECVSNDTWENIQADDEIDDKENIIGDTENNVVDKPNPDIEGKHVAEKKSDYIANGKHIIRKGGNKNKTQQLIDALNFTENLDLASQLSSCGRMGLSFGILIVVVSMFV